MSDKQGFIFDIYRGTTHDGPGMRSTVFLKGCSLHCQWCHNPESISPSQQLWWEENQCIGCMSCVGSCEQQALRPGDGGIEIDRARCVVCGRCTKICPTGAMSFVGRHISAEKLIKDLAKYQAYYKNFGGGITASGGEPLVQHDFVFELFTLAKQQGIHTALDSCGYVPFSSYEQVLPLTGCLLYDLKLMNDELHRKHAGSSNRLILDNLLKIAEGMRSGSFGCELWIRTPLIPGITDTEENLLATAEFIIRHLSDLVSRWELCTFNKACANKYRRLGIEWACGELPMISRSRVESIRELILSTGFDDGKLVISGLSSEN